MANPVAEVVSRSRWSPYVVGTGIGVLSWITFGFMDKALGTSTTMVRAAGAIVGLASQEHVAGTAYYAKYLVKDGAWEPIVDWQFALVIFLIIGAFVSAWLSRRRGGLQVEPRVPPTWSARFGSSPGVRYAGAFLGGVVLLFGARLAGGCTSGHGISGGLQMAVSGWTFFITTFVGGIGTAMLLYRKGARHA